MHPFQDRLCSHIEFHKISCFCSIICITELGGRTTPVLFCVSPNCQHFTIVDAPNTSAYSCGMFDCGQSIVLEERHVTILYKFVLIGFSVVGRLEATFPGMVFALQEAPHCSSPPISLLCSPLHLL